MIRTNTSLRYEPSSEPLHIPAPSSVSVYLGPPSWQARALPCRVDESVPHTQPHGRARPFHEKSTCLTQSPSGPYVVQIWSCETFVPHRMACQFDKTATRAVVLFVISSSLLFLSPEMHARSKGLSAFRRARIGSVAGSLPLLYLSQA